MSKQRESQQTLRGAMIGPMAALVAVLLLSSCGSWFADDKESNLDGECVGKDYEVLNDLIAAPFQSCNTSSECPSGSYCESDSNVHHTAASGAICYWQCYSDSDCGFGNHCDCNGQCESLDNDAGPGVDPSCPRSEGLLETLASGVQYNSIGAASEWQLQETVEPLLDTTGTGCSFSNLTTGGAPGTALGVLGTEAVGLGGRLAWSTPIGGSNYRTGPQAYLECDDTSTMDLGGTESKAVRVVFRIPPTTTIGARGSFDHGQSLIGKRDGLDAPGAGQGKGWNISFDGANILRVILYDGSGTVERSSLGITRALVGGPFNDGEWHYIEMVVDRSGALPILRARSDRWPRTAITMPAGLDLSTSTPMRIGSHPNAIAGTPPEMQIAHVATFSGAEAAAMIGATPDDTFWDGAEFSNGRSCAYNEDCPYGSKCDDDTKLCSFSCLGTDHATSGCTGTQVCDCFGDCVEPGTTPVRQNIDMPFMEVMPRDIPVSSEVFEPRRVAVNLVTEVAEVALVSTTVPITVTSPPDIEVSCDATDRTNGVYGQSCTLDNWSFDTHGARKRAAGSFWVRGATGSTSEETSWTVKLTSGGTAKHVEYVSVREFDASSIVPQTYSESEPALYRGTLSRIGLGTLLQDLPTDLIPLEVEVEAWVSETVIDFYDASKIISPSGWLRVDSTTDRWQTLLDIPAVASVNPLGAPTASGVIPAATIERSFDVTTGFLSGEFEMKFVGTTRWSFSLGRSGELTACIKKRDCSADESCTNGACVTGQRWEAGMTQLDPALHDQTAQNWKGAATELIVGSVLLSNAYSRTTGVTRTPTSTQSKVGQAILGEATGLGANMASGFMDYVQELFVVAGGPTNTDGFEISIVSDYQQDFKLCDSSQCPNIDPASLYRYFNGTVMPQVIKDTSVPCHSRVVTGGGNDFANIESHPEWQGFEYRGTCKELFDNHMANGASVADPDGSLVDFLDEDCSLTTYKLDMSSLGSPSQYPIYMCPLLGSFSGSNSGSPELGGQSDLCFKPSGDVEKQLISGPFGTMVQEFSGDLLCDSGSFPNAVKVSNYLDRQVADTSPEGYTELLSDCLQELAKQPQQYSTAMTAGNSLQRLEELFSESKCFSSATFYSAIADITAGQLTNVPWNPAGGSWRIKSQRLLTRILQQWTELHSFIATEGRSVAAMADNLRYRTDLGVAEAEAVNTAPQYQDLLDEAERGWQLLLSFDDVISGFRSRGALLYPDYRPAAQQTNSPDHEQDIGLPVLVFEGLAAHMNLLDSYLRKTRVDSYGQCYDGSLSSSASSALERSQRALHYANLVSEVWGSTVAAVKAQNPATVIPWEERWDRAQIEFQSTRSQVIASIGKIQSCDGGLEGLVPLFFGDANGTSSRYFAASDYILNGWAAPAVQSAINSLTGARTAYVSQRNSQLQDLQTQSDADFRLAELKDSLGNRIIDYCGLTGVNPESVIENVALFDGLSLPGQVDPVILPTCHINDEIPGCKPGRDWTAPLLNDYVELPTIPDRHSHWSEIEVQYEMCFAANIKTNFGLYSSQTGSEAWQAVALATNSNGRFGQYLSSWETVFVNTGADIIIIGEDQFSPGYFERLRAAINGLSILGLEQRAMVMQAENDCAELALFAGISHSPIDQVSEIPDSPREENSECMRGTFGAGVARLLEVSTALDTAEQRLTEQTNAEVIVANGCKDSHLQSVETNALRQQHINSINSLKQQAAAASVFSNTISSVANFYVNPGKSADDAQALAGASIFGSITGAGFQDRIDKANADWEILLNARQSQAEYDACMIQAELIHNGLATWTMQVKEATRRFETAIIDLENQRIAAINLVHQARASIAREEGRLVTRYSHHYWLDEAIDSYERDFEHAQRLTFMALRAIEYEFQQSLDLRQDILGAKTPEELQNAIVLLRQEQFTRTLNSRRPEESQLVMSLRDQILRIDDQESDVAGERDWSATESFRDRVMSGTNAVFDDLGNYLGQGIRFDLLPDGALEHRCGERLWSMTATLQGDLLDVDAPNTSVFVIRNNSFSSQWCEGHEEEGAAYQTASMLPVGGLFQPDNQGGSESFGLSKITAMLQPWFNVPRSEFYKESYSEGASEEFAGRGLYGEYTILFPWKGLLEDGFPLERVEDILIRFDYISVDNLTNL